MLEARCLETTQGLRSMPSHSESRIAGATGVLTRVALFGAIGAALAVIETVLPRPVPWIRLGLGHVAVLLALFIDGPPSALAVLMLKVALAGLVGGTFAQPTMFVSAVAGIGAWAAMSLTFRLVSPSFMGPVGVSVVGALTYGMVQVWLIGEWLVRSSIWRIAPVVIVPGVVAGAVTGLAAALTLWQLDKGRVK